MNPFEDLALVDTLTGEFIGAAEVEMMFRDKQYLLSTIYIESKYRRQGFGSRLLRMVCDVADGNDITLTLNVDDIMHRGGEPNTMSKEELRKWYGRYGFIPASENSLTMKRQPS